MKLSRISFLLLFVLVQYSIFGQTLPPKVKTELDKNYSGWKQSAVAGDADCSADIRDFVVVGDFDGNGKRDYVVRITHKQKGYFIAFLQQNTIYKPFVLLSLPAKTIKYYGMWLEGKGRTYSIGDPENNRTSRSPNDAPYIGDCGSEPPYIFRNGRFRLGDS